MKTFRLASLFLWSLLTLASPALMHAQYPAGYELTCSGGDQPIVPGTFDPITQLQRAYLCASPINGHVSSPVFSTSPGTVTSVGFDINGATTPCGAITLSGTNPVTGAGTINLVWTGVQNDVLTFNASNCPQDSGTLISSLTPPTWANLAGGTNTASAMLCSGTCTFGPSGTGAVTANICNSTTSQCNINNFTQTGGATAIIITPNAASSGILQLKTPPNDFFSLADALGDELILSGSAPAEAQLGDTNFQDSINFLIGSSAIAGTGYQLLMSNGLAAITATKTTFSGALAPNSGHVLLSSTAPTIASGFGTTPTIPHNNGPAAFTVNVGTGGTATTGVITLPAATTGWSCHVDPNAAPQAAGVTYSVPTSATSITLTNYTATTGVALAWTSGEVLQASCFGY